MKRIAVFLIHLLCMVVLMAVPGPVQAAPSASNQQAQAVQTLEDTLFAVHYDQESLDARVSRLEETVFGQAQTGATLDARIAKLKSALSPSALGPLSPTAKAKSAPNNNEASQNNASTASQSVSKPKTTSSQPTPRAQSQPVASQTAPSYKAIPAPGETDYPTVSQMEQKLFSKTYTQEDITQRLARLEKEVFKVPQTGALADRVDNLRLVVLGDMGAPGGNNATAYSAGPSAGSAYNNYPGPANAYPPQQYTQIPPSGQGYQPYYGGSASYPQSPNYGAGRYGDPYSGTPIASNQPYGGSYYGQSYNGGDPGNYPPIASASPGTYAGGNGYAPPSASASTGGAATPDMLAAMQEVEKEVLGHTYPSEPMNTRLERLENKVFHATSPELSDEERMQRVIAVSSAGGAPESRKTKAKHTFQTLLPIILTILPMVLL